jgi:hypothetical protein
MAGAAWVLAFLAGVVLFMVGEFVDLPAWIIITALITVVVSTIVVSVDGFITAKRSNVSWLGAIWSATRGGGRLLLDFFV